MGPLIHKTYLNVLKNILLFAVICSMYSASAQLVYVKEKPSFYLGQRLALDINLGVQLAAQPQRGPREIDLEPKRYGGNLAGIFVHANPEVTANFALRNAFGIYGKVGYSKRSRVASSSSFNGLYEYGATQISGTSLGAGLAFFFREYGSISPLGSQLKVGMSLYNYKVKHQGMFYASSGSYDNLPENPDLDLTPHEVEIRHGSVDVEYSFREAISDKLYYNIGVSTSLNFNSREDKVKNTDELLFRLEKSARESFILKDLLVFKVGLGVFL
jgi:hypothetical protein